MMTFEELLKEIDECPCGTAGGCMTCAPMADCAEEMVPRLFRMLPDGSSGTWKDNSCYVQ